MRNDPQEYARNRVQGCPVALAKKTQPLRDRQHPPTHRAAYAQQLGGDALRAGRKHGADQAHHQIKGSVLIGQHLGVAFVKLGGDALGQRARPGLFNGVQGDVHPGHQNPRTSGRKRDLPGPAAHIQHPRARCDLQPGQKFQRTGFEILGEMPVVACHPGGLESGLEGLHLGAHRVAHVTVSMC